MVNNYYKAFLQRAFYFIQGGIMDKKEIVDVLELNNEEIADLYEKVLEHLDFLNGSILDENEVSDEQSNEN